jgi:hypothetical protein
VSYPVAGSATTTLLGVIAFLCVLFRLIDPPGSGDITREIGVWLGLVGSAGVALGGYLGIQEPGALHQAQSAG